MMLAWFRRLCRSRKAVSAEWLRDQCASEWRNQFHGVSWNWQSLIDLMRARDEAQK